MPMSRTPKIRNPIPRERSTKIVPHVMNAEDLVEKKWWIHLSRSLLDGLLGVLSLVFDVLSGRLALLLDALETFLSSRRLYRLGSLLGRWLQAFTRIPGYVGRLLL